MIIEALEKLRWHGLWMATYRNKYLPKFSLIMSTNLQKGMKYHLMLPPLSIEISCSLGLSQCKRARCNGLWPDIVKGEQLNIMNLTYNTLCSIFKETTREHCKVQTKSLIMHMRCAKDEKVFLRKFSRWLCRRYVQNAVKQLYQAPIQLLWICRIGE